MPPPILGSTGARGLITRWRVADPETSLQEDTWNMTGVFEDGVELAWSITIGDTIYSDTITMATDLATTGALLAASIEAEMPADTVAATFLTDTLTLTSEALGLRFTEDFVPPGPGVEPLWPTTASLGATDSAGNYVPGLRVSQSGRASKQPARGEDLKLLPEGCESTDAQVFLTYLDIVCLDEHDGRDSDIIEDSEGRMYLVRFLPETRAVIPHFAPIAVRIPPDRTAPVPPEPPEPPPEEEP
jgi:hypothetical protein